MATLWAALFLLGESLTWPEIVGGALVVPGMIVLQQKDQRTNAPLHPLQFLGGNEEGNQE